MLQGYLLLDRNKPDYVDNFPFRFMFPKRGSISEHEQQQGKALSLEVRVSSQ